MDIETFLDLKRKYKSSLKKENLILIVFAFLCFCITLVSINFLYNKLVLEPSILYETFVDFENLLLYPAATLIFLIWYYLGIRCSKINPLDWLHKKFSIKSENFTYDNFIKLFDFQGVLRNKHEEKQCLYLNSSSEGLITKQGFNNFVLSFKAKIFYKGFGIILCARDLENYFMFRVRFDKKKDSDSGELFIVPHIRKDGIWEKQEIRDDKEKIKNGEVLKFSITKKNRFIKLIIKNENNKIVKEFGYLLPNYFPLRQSDEELFKNIVPEVEFPKFGKIGFRAYGSEEQAIIYNLEIEKIKN